MRVLLHYGAGPRLSLLLDELTTPDRQVSWSPEADDAALHGAIADADALLHVLEPVTAATMDAAPRLRLIQKLGVGVNTIDLDEAAQRGIAVANMPGVNAGAVAEHALALMLAVLRRIPQFDADVRAGSGWPLDASIPERLGEIAGRTVGFVGYGAIPRRLEPALVALGATVIHHRRDRSAPGWVAFDDLLARSDIVSVHVPLTDDTLGLVDAAAIEGMRPGAIMINTGRGGVIDETALVDALRSGHLLGAGLDVFADEPLPPGSTLTALPNVVLTPHVGWLTFDTLARCVRIGVENCERLRLGEPLANRVV